MNGYYEIYWNKRQNDRWRKNYEAPFDINGVYTRVEADTIWSETRNYSYIFRAVEKATDIDSLPPPKND